jgi:hypothetical protein
MSENVSQLKYFGMIVTNQNLIQKEIKRQLNSDNACYHYVQNFLPSCMLSERAVIRIYRALMLPMVLYGCKAWFLTLREGHKVNIFENRVLRRIFGPKRMT